MDPQQKQKPDELIFELDDDYLQAELKQPLPIEPTLPLQKSTTLAPQNTSPPTTQTHSQSTQSEYDTIGSNNTFCYTSPITNSNKNQHLSLILKKQPGSASSLFFREQQSPLASFLERGLLPSGAKEKSEPEPEPQAEPTKCNTDSGVTNHNPIPLGIFEFEL